MISICVFSKNRPLQLDTLLRSALCNAEYITDFTVIYTYDDNKFLKGYKKLEEDYTNTNFINEKECCESREDWKRIILGAVEDFHPYFLWATDDSLFYRKHDLTQEKIDWAFNIQGAASINLRMGLNIVWQNHWHSEKVPEFTIKEKFEDLIVSDVTHLSVNNDVGRVWQNDASIMPRDLYLERLKIEDHWYKGKGCRGLDNVGQSGNIFSPRIMCCFEESCYLNIPVNLVHLLDDGRLYANNWGKFIQQDIHSLHDKFLEGKRIDWKAIDLSDLDCGRKEVEYKYI